MKKLYLIFIALALFYLSSFTARFFQDDWRLLEMGKSLSPFLPIPNFPYRPLSVQIFYSLNLNPFGFHLLLFIFFCSGLFFLHKITKSLLVVFIYAFNISLFPLFYWIATSYFTFAFFFVMAASYFYLNGSIILTILLISLGLLSNEIVLVFPGLFFLWDFWKGHFQWKKLFVLTVLDLIYFFLRKNITTIPIAIDYTVVTNPVIVFQTFRWYALRLFNLPEGVRSGLNLIPLVFLLIVLIIAAKKYLPLRTSLFALGWFLVGAAPFFFLPYHMSSYYLTLSLVGSSILMSEIFKNQKLLSKVFICCYLLLAITGLIFLSQTHWIILKPTL